LVEFQLKHEFEAEKNTLLQEQKLLREQCVKPTSLPTQRHECHRYRHRQ